MDIFMSIATTFGLPVCLCVALLWFIYKLWGKSEAREEVLHAELAKSQQILSETTIILKELASDISTIQAEMSEVKIILAIKENNNDNN